jgi:hypothetical protein
MLIDQRAVPGDENGMRVGLVPGLEARADRADQVGIEPLLLRRRDRPAIRQFGRSAESTFPLCFHWKPLLQNFTASVKSGASVDPSAFIDLNGPHDLANEGESFRIGIDQIDRTRHVEIKIL